MALERFTKPHRHRWTTWLFVCLLFVVSTSTTTSGQVSALHRFPSLLSNTAFCRRRSTSSCWLVWRGGGGSDPPPPRSRNNVEDHHLSSSSSSSSSDDDENWHDAREDDYTDDEGAGLVPLPQQQEEEEEDWEAEEEDGLAQVLLEQEEEEEEETLVVDAVLLEEEDMETSSANVDRDDLADAYDDDDDEEVVAEEKIADAILEVAAKSTVEEVVEEAIEEAIEEVVEEVVEEAIEEAIEEVDTAATTNNTIIIDDNTKQILVKKLHWKPREVKFMRPDMAAIIVHKQLIRPREGMPTEYYLDVRKAPKPKGVVSKLVQTAVVPLCLGAVALWAGQEMGVDVCHDIWKKVPSWAALPKLSSSKTSEDYNEAGALVGSHEEDSSIAGTAEETSPTTGSDKSEDHPHSVKPTNPQIVETDEAEAVPDHRSALDKFLDKIEHAIKALFQKKI